MPIHKWSFCAISALGLLVGCVAPDLNNILSGIVSYPDLLLMGLLIIAAEALMHGGAIGVSTHP